MGSALCLFTEIVLKEQQVVWYPMKTKNLGWNCEKMELNVYAFNSEIF